MNREDPPLVVVETHPVQYHAPVYRAIQKNYGIPVKVVYGSDFSVAGYRDAEFETSFAWDVDLVSGNEITFLSRLASGGARSVDKISSRGMGRAFDRAKGAAVLLTGYRPAFHRVAFYEAWRRRLPILFRAETTDHASTRNSVHEWLRDRALRHLYSLCGRVLPIGSRSCQHYKRLGVPDSKIVFSPYCVDTAPFQCQEADRERLRPVARRELGLATDEVAVLFSGKLSARKGVHVLAEAVKLLPAAVRARIVLVFLGAGHEQGALAAACAAVPTVPARFVGFRNQRHLSPYYHAADLLALPSVESETWGLVINEALHHGLPCVVSDAVGCAPDLIEAGVTGEAAQAGSPKSLASALEQSLLLIRKQAVRARCRAKVSSFSVNMAAEGIARAFWELTGASESPFLMTAKS